MLLQGKNRDVDVTVTVQSENGEVTVFKAAEVKHEGRPLDVGPVEQLCLKLADMPKVTHKSIFYSSGYTDGAISKGEINLFIDNLLSYYSQSLFSK